MSTLKHGSLVVLALALAASEAAAQARPATRQPATQRQAAAADQGFWELGQDVALAIGIDDPKTLTITIPALNVRAGYYVSNVLSLEPALRFVSVAAENQTASSFWTLMLGGLYHLSPSRTANQIFIHPAIGFAGASGGAQTRTILAAGVGMKKPMLNNRLAGRGEVGLNHVLKSGALDASTSIVLSVGWSVYTR